MVRMNTDSSVNPFVFFSNFNSFLRRLDISSRNSDVFHSGCMGVFYHFLNIFFEPRKVEMAMGIEHICISILYYSDGKKRISTDFLRAAREKQDIYSGTWR